jgi:hypothetical protein
MAMKLKLELEREGFANLQVFLARLIEKPDSPRFKTAVIESSVLEMMRDIQAQTGVGLETDMPGEVSSIPKRESKIANCEHVITARRRCALCGVTVETSLEDLDAHSKR